MNDVLDIFGQAVSRAWDTLNDAYPGLPWIALSALAAAIILSTAAAVRCGVTTQRGTPCSKGKYGATCHHHRHYGAFGPDAGKAGLRVAFAVVAFAPAVVLAVLPLLSSAEAA